MLITETDKSTIELYDNRIVKTLKTTTITPEWEKAYRKISKQYPVFVKLIEVYSPIKYSMEYIHDAAGTVEGIIKRSDCYHLLDKVGVINVITSVNDAFSSTLRFSESIKGDQYFIHTDLTLANILFTKNKRCVVIDPDSFTFVKNLEYSEKFYMTQINLMYNIQKYHYEKEKNV
jgi:hypothetical protein